MRDRRVVWGYYEMTTIDDVQEHYLIALIAHSN